VSIAAASQEHLRGCYLNQISERLADDVDDGVVAEQVLAERAREADWVVVEDPKPSDAGYQHVRVLVLRCHVVSHLYD
jgi:hypothetical protein